MVHEKRTDISIAAAITDNSIKILVSLNNEDLLISDENWKNNCFPAVNKMNITISLILFILYKIFPYFKLNTVHLENFIIIRLFVKTI